MVLYVIKSLRPHQWTKNILLFAGLIFSHHLFSAVLLLRIVVGFGIFCLVAGGIYIINDLVDRKKDQQHPLKRQRPIASGKISAGVAKKLSATLLVISLVLAYGLNPKFSLVCLGYAGLMIGYSVYLKNVAILDVIIIAMGIVLRAVAGVVIIDVAISPWLLVCTLFLSLFLVLCKRRHEMVLLGQEANNHRQSLAEYSPQLLDQMIAVVTGSTLIAYALYTLASRTTAQVGSNALIVTIPFVIFGVFRYLYLVYEDNQGGAPELAVFSDKPLVMDVVLWIVVVVAVLYVA